MSDQSHRSVSAISYDKNRTCSISDNFYRTIKSCTTLNVTHAIKIVRYCRTTMSYDFYRSSDISFRVKTHEVENRRRFSMVPILGVENRRRFVIIGPIRYHRANSKQKVNQLFTTILHYLHTNHLNDNNELKPMTTVSVDHMFTDLTVILLRSSDWRFPITLNMRLMLALGTELTTHIGEVSADLGKD